MPKSNQLNFHPSKSSCLISGSTDGLVNVFDNAMRDEDDALLQIVNHGSSIHHAGFISDKLIFALSHDEILSLYPSDHSGADDDSTQSTAFGDLRSRLDCDYAVDMLSSHIGAPMIAVGSHRYHFLLQSRRFRSSLR